MFITPKIYKEYTSTDQSCYEMGAILADDFELFISFYHYHLTGSNFIFKPFHKRLIKVLDKYARGKNEKQHLIINIFPRSGKTQMLTYFIAWTMIRNVRSKSIYTSYADSLAYAVSDAVKDVMESELFKRCYDFVLDPRRNAKENWRIESYGGGLYAAPMGGRITGFGAGILGGSGYTGALFIDDPIKTADCLSASERGKKIFYYAETLKNRLNMPDETPIIIIMQRLHHEDLCGYIESNPDELKDYEIVKFPLCDEDITETIWPERYSLDFCRKLKATNPHYFYSQYMQSPMIRGGNVIKTKFFRYYDGFENVKINRCFITADTAMTIKEASDFTVFSSWAIDSLNNLYLVDMVRGRWESPDLIREAINLWNRTTQSTNSIGCIGFYIEDKSSGTTLVQLLQNSTGIPVIGVSLKDMIKDKHKDKLARVEMCLPYLESGKVFLPENRPILLNDFLFECESFSRNNSHSHDDIVDTLTMAIALCAGSVGIPAGAIL